MHFCQDDPGAGCCHDHKRERGDVHETPSCGQSQKGRVSTLNPKVLIAYKTPQKRKMFFLTKGNIGIIVCYSLGVLEQLVNPKP